MGLARLMAESYTITHTPHTNLWLIHSQTLCPAQLHVSAPCHLLSRTAYPAFIMLEGKAVIGETDMLQTMQQDALHLAAKALDFCDVTEATEIARFIKKEFDRMYGPGWQCIVGTDFGSVVTHCYGCFIYFRVGSLAILLFKVSAGPEAEENQFPVLESVKA